MIGQFGVTRQNLPYLVVLALIGLFQSFRGQWVDLGIFIGAIMLVLLPPPRWFRAMFRGKYPQPSLGILVTIAIPVALLLVVADRHGAISGVVITLLGVAVVGFAWLAAGVVQPRDRQRSADPAHRRARNWWIAVILVLGFWEAFAYLSGRWFGFDQLPSISELFDPALNLPLGKTIFVVVWLAGGIWLLRRGWPAGQRRHDV